MPVSLLTHSLLVYDCSRRACNIRLPSRHAVHHASVVSHAGRKRHRSCKSLESWQSSTREGHGRNLQANSEVVEVVCFRGGIRGKQTSMMAISCLENTLNILSSCSAVRAVAMATSPSGSSPKDTRSSIETSCPPELRSSPRLVSYSGASCRITRAVDSPGS